MIVQPESPIHTLQRRRLLAGLTALGAGAGCQTSTTELRKFYYDTAQVHHDGALKALLAVIPPSQVLYGTDYPFWDGRKVSDDLAKGGFSNAERMAIDRNNALRLFPRLKA